MGECKWGTGTVGRGIIRELVEDKTPKVLANLPDGGQGWAVHYAFFARGGFTEAAQAEGERHQGMLVPLALLNERMRVAADL